MTWQRITRLDDWMRRHVARIVMVLSLIAVLFIAAQTIKERAITACQGRVNNAFAANIKLRAQLADQDRAATKGLIFAVFTVDPHQSAAQRQAAVLADYAVYRKVEQGIDRARAEHPFPDLPAQACG